ncbi:hypothetical protein M0802_002045 [Mischocyttarus mexicanus]|nr:hypothetical protein M0802_002045 [Mischocyttarus mexicanus]
MAMAIGDGNGDPDISVCVAVTAGDGDDDADGSGRAIVVRRPLLGSFHGLGQVVLFRLFKAHSVQVHACSV